MNRRLPALLLTLLAASLWACADDSTSGPTPGAAGEAAADRGLFTDWALLSVPTAGGPAALHPLADPGGELWSGAVSLPAVDEAVRVAPRLVALRGSDGTVHRYDPAEGAVSELGELAGEARWHGGESGGVWARQGDDGGLVWSLSTGGGVRRTVGRPLRWAGPAEDGVTVALLGSGPATLVRWPRGGEEPDASLEIAAGPPAEMTAWGRLAVLTRSDEAGVLQIVSVSEMEARERIDVGGPVTALAASPSSHEIYVGVDDPPRLVVVDRFGGDVSTRARLPRTIREIRPGIAGGPPVVWDGQAAHLVPWEDGEPVRLQSAWRSDLPLSLPDGSALVIRDGVVQRALVGDGATSSSGAADRIWIPIRWRAEAEAVSTVDTAEQVAIAASGADTTAGAAAGDTAAGAAASSDSAAADSAALSPSLRVTDPGFYVVLGWSRSPAGILERLRGIRTAGFPVAVQTRRDDAGAEWYRGMVGPYSRRERAQQVAGTLQREHAVEGWVQEVRPGLISDEVFR